jgi:hypothetical protein
LPKEQKMKDTDKRTVAIFDSLDQVEEGIQALTDAGIKRRKISVVTQSLETETKIHGYVTHGEVTREGAGTGAWVGGLFGLLIGAAFIWVPGFGPLLVAGPLATALLGGVEGAVAGAAGGGLLGALFGRAVEKQHIPKYEEAIKSGKFLLVVSGKTEVVEQALRVLENHGGEVSMHAL